MTNDYKEKLLNYLTGNIQEGTESSTPYYLEQSKRANNNAIVTGFYKTEIIDTLYCRDGNGNYNGKVLVYGNGNTSNNQSVWNGFIQLYDNNFNLIKMFKEYSSGTKFSVFEKLNIDEIGQIYGIDYSSNKHRFIMLNNISEKGNLLDYQCVLRQSYFLQDDISNTFINIDSFGVTSYMLCVEKSKQSALYFMGGLDGGMDFLYGESFRINVGAENEWIEYTDGVVYHGTFIDSYVYFDQDDNISCNFYFKEQDANDKYVITRTSNTGTSLNQWVTLVEDLEQYVANILTVTGIIINENKFYFSVSGYDSSKTYVKEFLYNNGNITNVYNKEVNAVLQNGATKAYFAMLNNQYFTVITIGSQVSGLNLIGDVYVNLLTDESVDYEAHIEDSVYLTSLQMIAVSNVYNIYSILYSAYPSNVVDPDFITYTIKYIHRNGYNGEEYEGNSSLLPQQGILFDSQDNLIFARDLYNFKVYNNRSISTLNVPNTYLNNVSIAKENLIGDTNVTLIENTESIDKNIYEDLYINFNNQIKMQNRNNTNYVDNESGAIRVNQSSSKLLDYSNAKASKIRVNYDDDTTYITSAYNTITDDVCTYQIGIKVPNDTNIKSIEIISNDENTTYQTITGLNLENNKYYIISQDVHIE